MVGAGKRCWPDQDLDLDLDLLLDLLTSSTLLSWCFSSIADQCAAQTGSPSSSCGESHMSFLSSGKRSCL